MFSNAGLFRLSNPVFIVSYSDFQQLVLLSQ